MSDKIVEHLEKHELIRESQHGFVKKKSCLSNLLVFIEEVTSYLDSGYPVDVIYLDFQKAFDKVPHHRLLMKLQAHGIGGNVLQWIGNWLSGVKGNNTAPRFSRLRRSTCDPHPNVPVALTPMMAGQTDGRSTVS